MLPDSAYVRKIIMGSIPLMFCLTFLLFETYQRSKLPPYVAANGNETLETYLIDLRGVVFVFLWVALLCCILIIYCLHTMPRKKVLLRKFLEEGQSISGDVFYPEDHSCYGLCPQYGTVTYSDPRRGPQHRNTYIRRSVRLFENFSREWVSILVLPDRPYSGHPKNDVEMAYLATDREKPALSFLAAYASVWVVLSIAGAVYVLWVVSQNKYKEEFPDGWMWFGICLVLMPVLATAVNFLIFQRHMRWMTKGDARILEKGELKEEGKQSKISRRSKNDAENPVTEYEQMDDSRQMA